MMRNMSERQRRIHVLNGPNLNLLGIREPRHYGPGSLADLRAACADVAAEAGLDLVFRQSNHEGELIDWIHQAGAETATGEAIGAVLNMGAYAHTSIAIRDAVTGCSVPAVEVHLSNVYAREEFRHVSHVTSVCLGVVAGLGPAGYRYAIEALAHHQAP